MNPPPTLPDLLRDGLDIVFVGINPSLYSVERGHYFARRANRFWPCLSRSALSAQARAALGVAALAPEHDRLLLEHGIGFTDVAKRATARADEVSPAEFAAGAHDLAAKIERHRPLIACFHGLTGYRPFQAALAPASPAPALGLQAPRIGRTRLFVVPNPSPANAHFTPADQTAWYDRLAVALAEARGIESRGP
ncbi:MAG TPA: mismatch-specific DNA-glycosylase [Stellaceae bacterium]|nr:mismatch-specific DNA-glycosylase [Stellaceae bacterium]